MNASIVAPVSLNARGRRYFEEPAVPEVFKDDIPLNHATVDAPDSFKVKQHETTEQPTPEQVAANREKWGYDPSA